jgi:hypothetical protein
MFGPPKLRALDQTVTISLEFLVPAHHFNRHLKTNPDLSFVRDWAAPVWAASPLSQMSAGPAFFNKLGRLSALNYIRPRPLSDIATPRG